MSFDLSKCPECGADTGWRSWIYCQPCRERSDSEKERQRFEAAEKVTEWDGYVYHGGEFYSSVDMLEERFDYEDGPYPAYVWTCKASRIVGAHITDITDRICDEADDDFDPETLKGLKELQAALDAFNEANKDVVAYEPDYTKAVLLSVIDKDKP